MASHKLCGAEPATGKEQSRKDIAAWFVVLTCLGLEATVAVSTETAVVLLVTHPSRSSALPTVQV